MNIGIGILVFFISLIALVAEFILYLILGIGTSVTTDNMASISSLAFFFVGLMIITGAIGILYPICSIIATISKNKGLGNKIFLILLGLVIGLYFIIFPIATRNQSKNSGKISSEKVTNTINTSSSISGQSKSEMQKPATNNLENDYIKNSLLLKDVTVKEGYGQFDVPGYSQTKKAVSGNIKNIGDKSLQLLAITIYFLDANGSRVGEKSFTIINTQSMFDTTPPLKPNYSKDFGYIVADDAPSDWAGKVEVEISKIKFEE